MSLVSQVTVVISLPEPQSFWKMLLLLEMIPHLGRNGACVVLSVSRKFGMSDLCNKAVASLTCAKNYLIYVFANKRPPSGPMRLQEEK